MDSIFKVIKSEEGQYSILDIYKDTPSGWKDTGFSGLKGDCLAHIKEIILEERQASLNATMNKP
ncbi:MAG: MbtH family NRPS accessory protein [Saprospiraceae bacterium]|nr:MbtH family NRPS accessory protein [Saprospiraceae bacterium]